MAAVLLRRSDGVIGYGRCELRRRLTLAWLVGGRVCGLCTCVCGAWFLRCSVCEAWRWLVGCGVGLAWAGVGGCRLVGGGCRLVLLARSVAVSNGVALWGLVG